MKNVSLLVVMVFCLRISVERNKGSIFSGFVATMAVD